MAYNRKSNRIEQSKAHQCTRPSQQVTIICQSCNQEKIRTIRRAGGRPLYCDDCNNPTHRATRRKQKERTKKGQPLQEVIVPTFAQSLLSQVSVQPNEVACHRPDESCDPIPETPDNPAIQAEWYPHCVLPYPLIPAWTSDPSIAVPAKPDVVAQASFQQNCKISYWKFHNQIIDAWFVVVREHLGKEYMDKECWGSPVPCTAMAKQMEVSTVELVQWLIKEQSELLNLSEDGQFFSITDPMERLRAPGPCHLATNGAAVTLHAIAHPNSVIAELVEPT